jgi:hypothetical protein
MIRSFFDATTSQLIASDTSHVVGALTARLNQLGFAVDPGQSVAWTYQIEHLKQVLFPFPAAHVFFEFSIPRMGRRADVILLLNGFIFVLEYKVGQSQFTRHDIEQTLGYALDLSHFHETSHRRTIVPVLVATHAHAPRAISSGEGRDNVWPIILTNQAGLQEVLSEVSLGQAEKSIPALDWSSGRFKPTPTIVEAAQALYRKHSVDQISRNEAGATNLSVTSTYIEGVINNSRANGIKSICFVTGVPGSGKTLAGLTIANSRMEAGRDNHAVFLSGNGPLVDVLREALTLDCLAQQKEAPPTEQKSKAQVATATHAFIQNIHHYRDEHVRSEKPPVDRIAIFDEAQRAWDEAQTTKFMQKKRGILDFAMSEPELLLSIMDRHEGWATIICLVGGGQEINTGEAGIGEWVRALNNNFPHWRIHVSPQVTGTEYLGKKRSELLLRSENICPATELHLAVSLRSYRAKSVSRFVGELLANQPEEAKILANKLADFPIFVSRDLHQARQWLRQKRRGPERTGLLASSNALRLKPEGIFVKASIEPCKWFLAPSDDIRSSIALEDAASEFDVQGLELDWACVAWDANLRRDENNWASYAFSGTSWKRIRQADREKYLLNSYRVLLTRARQGMVIFVPAGDSNDPTRLPSFYDPIYHYLRRCGIAELPVHMTKAAIADEARFAEIAEYIETNNA